MRSSVEKRFEGEAEAPLRKGPLAVATLAAGLVCIFCIFCVVCVGIALGLALLGAI